MAPPNIFGGTRWACQGHSSHPAEQIQGWSTKTTQMVCTAAASAKFWSLFEMQNCGLCSKLLNQDPQKWAQSLADLCWHYILRSPALRARVMPISGDSLNPLRCSRHFNSGLKNQPQVGYLVRVDHLLLTCFFMQRVPGREAGPKVNETLEQSRGSQFVWNRANHRD